LSGKLGVARAAALLAVLTAASQLLGVVRDAVIAAVYGAGAALDAYLVAQSVMNLVLALVAGAMARAVVPPVSRAAAAGEVRRANRTVQTALTVTLLVLVSGSAVMYAAAEVVVALLAPGFDEPTAATAVRLTRVVLFATVFIAGTNLLAAAAQAHGRFLHSGLEGIPFNVVMIAAAAWFGERFGIEALAIGFVVGSLARLLVQLPPLRRFGLRLRPRFAVRDPDFSEVLRLAPPVLLTTAVVNVNTLVDRAVGSAQGDGVIAALSFGWRIVTLVDSLLVVTVAAALFPAFSSVGRSEDRAALRELVSGALRVMLVLLSPMTALLVVAAEPVVRLVFGRGDFDAAAVRLTAVAVVGYALSVLVIGVRSVASRACLAMGDRRTTVVATVVVMVINVVGDLTLGIAYGVAGLAASTSVSLLAGGGVLVFRLGRRHRAVEVRSVVVAGARVVTAAVLSGVACHLLGLPSMFGREGVVSTVGNLAVTTAVLFLGYVAVLALLRSSELREVTSVVRHRILPSRTRAPRRNDSRGRR